LAALNFNNAVMLLLLLLLLRLRLLRFEGEEQGFEKRRMDDDTNADGKKFLMLTGHQNVYDESNTEKWRLKMIHNLSKN
jgi:hypothetical protein